ncbi:ribosomal-protein-alanine N-acetyltransferase [Actinokineospora alba]|uniref:Ribosomal-protein-alanine N-acetyltransferase n=2 Tax=Actinokineospora alba TaxID=504798 RepID=A0A1H0F8E2_9PSEU|nr:ribosomal-protein-alanine N-acetyltransferase [Actinokineospora alba]SDI17896.1 ribosomal-protein-alanine N-acetyltransferase [Actinokineospora alba]SDN90865.1 ribosomal-protein-alanine N-acetyltransferase [Actinokineospora alba]
MCDDRDFWNILAQVELGLETAFISVDRDDRGIAGKFTVYNVLRGSSQSAMLGYNAFLPYAGTGRTWEALVLIVDTCFAAAPHGLELHRLEINCEPENARSIALARRLGFRHEGRSPRFQLLNGRWRDCEKFALTAEEWVPLRCCRPVTSQDPDPR